MIPWLLPDSPFPPVIRALEDGLLCGGADLSPARLLDAYEHGIFPWFSHGQPILWWSPDPRMVLKPAELRVTRSLDKVLRNRSYEVRVDYAFEAVMRACSQTPREGQKGTWITEEMIQAYCSLHQMGFAHSFETWIDDTLMGGLYGIAIGRMFYGESMFSHASDASKIAFVHLVRHLEAHGVTQIDCQMHTGHLASLGAREIPRIDFMRELQRLIREPALTSLADINYKR